MLVQLWMIGYKYNRTNQRQSLDVHVAERAEAVR
jgi:hypothetical protein